MSRIDDVNQAVASQSNTTVAAIKDGYSSACQTLLDLWLAKLNAFNENMARIMDILDDLEQDLDTNYQSLPDFPGLPDPPSIIVEMPDPTTIDLNCPIAECLGFPSIPSVDFSGGFPEIQTAETIAQIQEYTSAMKKTGEQLASAIGLSAEVAANNALEALQSAPQALLNGLVDIARSTIATLASATLMDAFAGQIACLESKDSRLSSAEEIVRFKELKARVEASVAGDGSMNFSGLNIPTDLANSLTDFNDKKSQLNDTLGSAKSLLGKLV